MKASFRPEGTSVPCWSRIAALASMALVTFLLFSEEKLQVREFTPVVGGGWEATPGHTWGLGLEVFFTRACCTHRVTPAIPG